MELNKLDEFVGHQIADVKLEGNSLMLSFVKKILFIKKTVTFKITSSENISSLAYKGMKEAMLEKVSIDRKNIVLVTKGTSNVPYTVSFRLTEVSRL